MIKFPENFLWGAASSAPQFEGEDVPGQKVETVWTYWYEKSPERFYERNSSKLGKDFNFQYKEDIKRMKAVGMNSFRTSISWARLVSEKGEVNEEAVAFYRDIFKEMIQHEIEPIVNLYHFDMPLWLYHQGGFETQVGVDAFEAYAKLCFHHFGDLISKWTTFNEPIVPVEMGYMNCHHLPEKRDIQLAIQVALNTLYAHKKAMKAKAELLPQAKLGIILNLTPSYPKNSEEENVFAARVADAFLNRFFLDTTVKGTLPPLCVEILEKEKRMPVFSEDEKKLISNYPVDFLGVNYYQPRRVQQGDGQTPFRQSFSRYFIPYQWPEAKINPHRGWEIYEKGLYDIAVDLKENYGNLPWYVAENGIGVAAEDRFRKEGYIQDDYRIDFMQNHLTCLHQAIAQGSNCFGYHVWTFVDNWSWLNAYKNRYGLYEKDLKTFERRLKKSGIWFKELTLNNGFEKVVTKDGQSL